MIAPDWNIQASSWLATLLYLYFALGRAAFVRTHCAANGSLADRATLLRAELAFGRATRPHRRGWSLFAGSVLAVGAAIDALFTLGEAGGSSSIMMLVLTPALIGWLAGGPGFLLTCGLWVREGEASPPRSFALLRRFRGRLHLPWLAIVLLIAVVGLAATRFLHEPGQAWLMAMLPRGDVVYLCGALFLACLIAFQLWLQAAYAAWMSAEALKAEQEAGAAALPSRAPRRATAATGAAVRPIRPMERLSCILAGATVTLIGALLLGQAVIDRLTAVDLIATVRTVEPWCQVEWREGRNDDRRLKLSCADAATFVAEHSDYRDIRMSTGAYVTVSYDSPDGRQLSFQGFLPDPLAASAVKSGSVSIEYHAGSKSPARFKRPNGPWFAALLLVIGLGVLLVFLPALRQRLAGAAHVEDETGHLDRRQPAARVSTAGGWRVVRLLFGIAAVAGIACVAFPTSPFLAVALVLSVGGAILRRLLALLRNTSS
ncbi:hypothetical protein [Labrys wisconsinensis]|uniref:DUF3592 domain-containing protein n=1 Tax=Labrys wisconsinensis TaxID=425677 RepID=A0ABU0JGY5_9HYPH|nr:hypothetical protein [Labrys wisconsinensis]MDQ0473560.1 hypothetical protein [Labrys wisconsinensis]